MNSLIDNTITFVKKELTNTEGGHDWFHIERVYQNTLLIAKKEDVDTLIVSLAALLHLSIPRKQQLLLLMVVRSKNYTNTTKPPSLGVFR